MSFIFGIVATPFGYVMRFIYEFVGSYGLSIILFSLLIKIVILPLTIKQKRGMMATAAIQPKIQEIQRKYGKDRQRMNEELQNLYANEGVSPMAGCGTSLLTLPIMIGLYYVVSQPLTYFMQLTEDQIATLATRLGVEMSGLGNEIGLAGLVAENFGSVADISDKLLPVSFEFLGFNLALTPSISEPSMLWIIPILSGLTALGAAFLQMRAQRKNNPTNAANAQLNKTNNIMLIVMPLMSLYFAFVLPAGLGLYWITNNVVSGLQEVGLQKYFQIQKAKEANSGGTAQK